MDKYRMLCLLMILCFGTSLAADVTYLYDDLNRLYRVEYSDETFIEYVYDDVGNRLEKTDFSFDSIVYEDAEDLLTDGWDILDNVPPATAPLNIYDADAGSQVIELSGSGIENAFSLSKEDGTPWNNDSMFIAQWRMNYSEDFTVSFSVKTSQGTKYLDYTPVNTDNLGSGDRVHHGLGDNADDGTWRTFTRDLAADLTEAQPTETLLSVEAFIIRGSGRVDDILLKP